MIQQVSKPTLNQLQHDITSRLLKNKSNILIAGCGSGKTRMAGNTLLKLIKTGDVKSFLIISPYNVISDSWIDFFNENKLSQEIVFFEKGKRILEKEYKSDFIVCSRFNLGKLLEKRFVDSVSKYFDFVIVDEVSMFYTLKSRARTHLKTALKNVKYKLFLTATPCGDSIEDIYKLFKLYDDGRLIGSNIEKFRLKYCDKIPYVQQGWNSKPESYVQLAKICKKDIVFFPYFECDNMITFENNYLDMPENVRTLYNKLKNDRCIFDKTYAAMSRAAKLNQIANGFFYKDKGVLKISNYKIEHIKTLVENDESVLFFYNFIHELSLLKALFPSIVNFQDSKTATKDWNEKKIKYLAISPLSAGHGVNLQHGGNVCVWLSFPKGYELYHQSIMRLARIGQKNKVIVKNVIVRGTVDEKNFERLMNKRKNQEDFFKVLNNETLTR